MRKLSKITNVLTCCESVHCLTPVLNLTGVRSGPPYADALSSAVVDEGTGSVTDVTCG